MNTIRRISNKSVWEYFLTIIILIHSIDAFSIRHKLLASRNVQQLRFRRESHLTSDFETTTESPADPQDGEEPVPTTMPTSGSMPDPQSRTERYAYIPPKEGFTPGPVYIDPELRGDHYHEQKPDGATQSERHTPSHDTPHESHGSPTDTSRDVPQFLPLSGHSNRDHLSYDHGDPPAHGSMRQNFETHSDTKPSDSHSGSDHHYQDSGQQESQYRSGQHQRLHFSEVRPTDGRLLAAIANGHGISTMTRAGESPPIAMPVSMGDHSSGHEESPTPETQGGDHSSGDSSSHGEHQLPVAMPQRGNRTTGSRPPMQELGSWDGRFDSRPSGGRGQTNSRGPPRNWRNQPPPSNWRDQQRPPNWRDSGVMGPRRNGTGHSPGPGWGPREQGKGHFRDSMHAAAAADAHADHMDTIHDSRQDMYDRRYRHPGGYYDYPVRGPQYQPLRSDGDQPHFQPFRQFGPDHGQRFPENQKFDSSSDSHPYPPGGQYSGGQYPQGMNPNMGQYPRMGDIEHGLQFQQLCTDMSNPLCHRRGEIQIETPTGEADIEPDEMDLEGTAAWDLLKTLGMGQKTNIPPAGFEININQAVLNALKSKFNITSTRDLPKLSTNPEFRQFMHKVLTHSAPAAPGEYTTNLTATDVQKILTEMDRNRQSGGFSGGMPGGVMGLGGVPERNYWVAYKGDHAFIQPPAPPFPLAQKGEEAPPTPQALVQHLASSNGSLAYQGEEGRHGGTGGEPTEAPEKDEKRTTTAKPTVSGLLQQGNHTHTQHKKNETHGHVSPLTAEETATAGKEILPGERKRTTMEETVTANPPHQHIINQLLTVTTTPSRKESEKVTPKDLQQKPATQGQSKIGQANKNAGSVTVIPPVAINPGQGQGHSHSHSPGQSGSNPNSNLNLNPNGNSGTNPKTKLGTPSNSGVPDPPFPAPENQRRPVKVADKAGFSATTAFGIAAAVLTGIGIILGPLICLLCKWREKADQRRRKNQALKNRDVSDNSILDSMLMKDLGKDGPATNEGALSSTAARYRADRDYTDLDLDITEREYLKSDEASGGYLP